MIAIPNARRLLVTALVDDHESVFELVKHLTGSTPDVLNPSIQSLSGTVHPWQIKTKYYSANATIWLDHIQLDSPVNTQSNSTPSVSTYPISQHNISSSPSTDEWTTAFLSPEAREVLDVLAGWVVCFTRPTSLEQLAIVRQALARLSDVVPELESTVCLAVELPSVSNLDDAQDRPGDGASSGIGIDWEDACLDYGFEYIDARTLGATKQGLPFRVSRNEFGELSGLARLREALEAADWEDPNKDGGKDGDDKIEDDSLDESTRKLHQILKIPLDPNDEPTDKNSTSGTDGRHADSDSSSIIPTAFLEPEFELAEALMSLNPPGSAQDGGDDDNDEERQQVDQLEGMLKKLVALRDAGGAGGVDRELGAAEREELRRMLENVLLEK